MWEGVCAWKVYAPQSRVRVESIGSADHLGRVMVTHGRLEQNVLITIAGWWKKKKKRKKKLWADERHAEAGLVL